MAEWRTPVFDRTMDDVKSVDRTSAVYQKGALNADDLNRIEDNYKYLMAKLRSDAIFIPHRLRNFTETVLEYVQTEEVGPEYTLVEYLESSGTQYIDTLYKWTSETTKIEMGFEYVGSPNAVSLFGSEVAGAQYSGVPWGNSASSFQMFIGTSKAIAQTNVSTNTNIDLVVSTSGGKLTVTINGTTQTTTFSGSVQNGRDIAIFTNNSSTGVTQHSKLKLKYFKMTDDGIVVRDFIPVLDFKKVACLFDKVEKKYYYNAGTGEFSAPETGHKVVEYIESSGTQYIDTKVVPTINTRVVFDVDILKNNSVYAIFGERHNTQTTNLYSLWLWSTTEFRTDFGASAGNTIMPVGSVLGRKLIDKNKNVTTIDGATVTQPESTISTTYPIYLLSNNYGGTADDRRLIAKIYSCQIYDNDILIRDFIPVIDADGVACLYDKLNHVYYRNEGTGTFTAGPEIPVETDPVYELIETQTTYTDWQENNLTWLSEINRIRANYNALVRLFLVGLGFSEQKESNYLDYIEVNNWERFALVGKTMFENMEKEYRFCGVEVSGGDRLL